MIRRGGVAQKQRVFVRAGAHHGRSQIELPKYIPSISLPPSQTSQVVSDQFLHTVN